MTSWHFGMQILTLMRVSLCTWVRQGSNLIFLPLILLSMSQCDNRLLQPVIRGLSEHLPNCFSLEL